MRLLYVCNDFGIPPDGTKGASVHLRSITRALHEIGHDVVLLSPLDGPGDDHSARRLLQAGCPLVRRCIRPLKRWIQAHDLNDAAVKELRPMLYNSWVLDKALAILRDSPPAAILERLSLFSTVGADLAQALRVPLVLEVNALLSAEAREFRHLQMGSLAVEVEHRTLTSAEAIIAVSRPLADQLAAAGAPSGKIHVVPNGVEPRAFDALPGRAACRSTLGWPSEAVVVGFCGSLKRWHGVDLLLRSFAEVLARDPTARLCIVGSGPCEAELHALAEDLGIAHATMFTGAVPHHQVPRYLRAMDVAVAPFRAREQFYFSPIKLFEYMAAGTCVIVSALGQMEAVIQDGVNGVLCLPDDAKALAAALINVHGQPALRQRVAEQAQADVRRRYTWGHTAERVVDIITALHGAAPSTELPSEVPSR